MHFFRSLILLVLACVLNSIAITSADEPIQLRVETLTVPPSTGPLAFVIARNASDADYTGEVFLVGPELWKLSPPSRPVTLAPGQTQRLAYSIAQGRNIAANRYAFKITARSDGQSTLKQHETFVASAPYAKIEVDGQTDEWKDAIPVAFSTGERMTTISTYWSRRQFNLLVEVDESKLLPYNAKNEDTAFDAVQLAISPLEYEDEPQDPALANRFEFLLVSTADGNAACFQLATPETQIETGQKTRSLDGLEYEDAEVVVVHKPGRTIYECSLPFRAMQDHIRPSEGREFYFSVLVHDPDETGVRDLGDEAGLWSNESDSDDWSRWRGTSRGNQAPKGNRVRWGLCTSKY